MIVRPNLPDPTEIAEVDLTGAEGLVGNRSMTAHVDGRGTTFDVYFPTVGLHSDVRPAEGNLTCAADRIFGSSWPVWPSADGSIGSRNA